MLVQAGVPVIARVSSRVATALGLCSCPCPFSWLCTCSPTPSATAGLPSFSSTLSRRRSRRGKPQPHFSHLRSMCWPHIRRQSKSSSASAFHDFDTCAARPKLIASRYPRMRRLTSRGSKEKGSIRIIWLSESDRCESCELPRQHTGDAEKLMMAYKQHMVRIPSRMSFRLACGAFENVDHN